MLALPIFPGGLPPSIVGAEKLNYRVRDGNGWTLFAINTNYGRATALHLYDPSAKPTEFGDPYGIRTHVAGVRGRSLRPLDQRAI